MNITSLLNRVKRKLGLKYSNIPVDDQDLIETIVEESLSTFSNYFPYNVTIPLDLDNNNKVPNLRYSYYINTKVLAKEMKILGIEDVQYGDTYSRFGEIYMSPGMSYDFISATAGANLMGACNIPTTWEFIAPNKVSFDEPMDYVKNTNICLSVTHMHNLSTIPDSYENEFIKLVLLDLKIFLYNNFKHYDNVDTPFGQVNLKMDDWNSAEGDRDTLIQRWDETFIYSRKFKMYNA